MQGLVFWMVGAALANNGSWGQLVSDAGWVELATRSSEFGDVYVSVKKIDGISCLQGSMLADAKPSALLDVVQDVDGALEWSSADLTHAGKLREEGTVLDFYQYIDVPDWTMVADRYWVLRAQVEQTNEAEAHFRWERLEAADAYPELFESMRAHDARAIQPPVNWGEWVFEGSSEGTLVRYRACADIGGAIPRSLQRWIATRTLPDTVTDVVREALRKR